LRTRLPPRRRAIDAVLDLPRANAWTSPASAPSSCRRKPWFDRPMSCRMLGAADATPPEIRQRPADGALSLAIERVSESMGGTPAGMGRGGPSGLMHRSREQARSASAGVTRPHGSRGVSSPVVTDASARRMLCMNARRGSSQREVVHDSRCHHEQRRLHARRVHRQAFRPSLLLSVHSSADRGAPDDVPGDRLAVIAEASAPRGDDRVNRLLARILDAYGGMSRWRG
jgi:hypothetical protein